MDEIAKIYERVILDSQDNVRRLNEKLSDIDKLCDDIDKAKKDITNIPDAFKTRLDQVVLLTEKHLKDLGAAIDDYLFSTEDKLSANLNGLVTEGANLKQEIDRLIIIREALSQVDFASMFENLQREFILKARQDIAVEFKKFENETSRLQQKINALETEVTRLSRIDLDKHFNSLQSTLAALSGSVAQINLNLNTIASTLGEISTKQTSLQKGISELKSQIEEEIKTQEKRNTLLSTRLSEITNDIQGAVSGIAKDLNSGFSSVNNNITHSADRVVASVSSNVENKIAEVVKHLENENQILKKEIKANRIIQIVTAVIVAALLAYVVSKVGK